MPVHSVTPVLNVSHVGQSLAWFEILGWQRGFSWNDGGLIGAGKDAKDSIENGDAGFGSVCSAKRQFFSAMAATCSESVPGSSEKPKRRQGIKLAIALVFKIAIWKHSPRCVGV